MKSVKTYHHQRRFDLESGGYLPDFSLTYTTLGQLNPDKSNVVWVCHALTGNSDPSMWWEGLFSADGAFPLNDFYVICANTIGGCYGSTGPLSVNPETGQVYYHEFPELTNRDVVLAFDVLRQHLGINSVHTLIGGSLGGQQVLEWAILRPQVFQHIVPIACNAWHSPWGIAFSETQRMAIELDPSWSSNSPQAGLSGLKVARAIAMISYRSHVIYSMNQSDASIEVQAGYRAASYQRYQGEKLATRFNAFSYFLLTKMMDSHQVGRGRGSVENALNKIKAKTLVLGIEQDILFPIQEQKFLASKIPGAAFASIQTPYAHDGFLVETKLLNEHLRSFLQSNKISSRPVLSGESN
jgi:homoserine O-acetyltransferase